VSTARTVTPRIKCAYVIFMVSATFFIVFVELHAFYPFSVALDQGFSNFFGPRHTISLCEI
jgi:hypothetical protein